MKKRETPEGTLAEQESIQDLPPEQDTYELSGVEHELVTKYQPKFLAKGGEHIVYEIPGHPDIVAKVSTEILKKVISWNAEHGLPIDALATEVEPHAREYLKQETERYQQLKQYFGAGHVLGQKKILAKVPLTERILNDLYAGEAPSAGNEAWGVVMVQRRAEELRDPEHLTLVAGYSEKSDVESKTYRAATEHLVFGKDQEQKIDREKLLAVQPNDHLKSLVERADNDESLKAALVDLIGKSISYTQETGEILDLAGADNITFSQTNGKWTYRLVDALYPGEKSMVDKTKIALLNLSLGNEIGEGERNQVMNSFNYARTINGLAEQFGVQQRVNMVPEGMQPATIDFLNILR